MPSGDLAARLGLAIDSYRGELAKLTAELIRIPSENPPGLHYRECAEALRRELLSHGLAAEVIAAPEERFAVRGFYGAGEPTLYFHGHYDVVPAQSREQFEPETKQDNLFGRGSADMKGGLAAMIGAVRALAECGVPLRGRVGLSFVPDEETGGRHGSRYLAERGLLGAGGIGMMTAEPTGGKIWNACRGAISLRVRVKGRPVHVGLHYRGVNAFEKALPVTAALLALKREVESRQTAYRIEPEAARGSILMLGGEAAGGDNFNVVPGEFSFTVDRRLNPEESLEQEKSRLLDLFERLRGEGCDLEVDVFQEGASAGLSQDAPLSRALAASIEEVTGREAEFELCPGLLEIRFYAERGVPALAFGPGLLSVSHGPHEFVQLGAVRDCALVYALTAARLLAGT
ncbi:MAG TPA: M20 family metallopeptidase [Thermoanaerobaculia bacterium]|nr:M20 family metallopeptidase [Thermoanaerobaculia bacterium]